MRLFWLIFVCAAVVTIITILPGCNAQKRLDHLLKNHPELISHDTIRVSKTITLPAFKKDTLFTAPHVDMFGLGLILDRYHRSLDSVNTANLTQFVKQQFDSVASAKALRDLKKQINTQPCLKDTLTITLAGGGTCKVYQNAGLFHALVNMPKRSYTVTTPYVQNHLNYNIIYKWNMFWAGVAIGILLSFILFMIFIKLKNK